MKIKHVVLLHIILLLFSFAEVLGKLASSEEFFSLKFILIYGGMIGVLVLYAFFWQQILKRMPLVFAYANKAVTVHWGLVFGVLLFGEQITVKKILGVALVGIGILVYSIGESHARE